MDLNSLSAVELFRKMLTSAERGVHVDTWRVTNHDLSIESPRPWSVAKETLHGGKQEGVDVIEPDNGELRITIIPTRGMGILRVLSGDVRLGWDSPVKEAVHPQFINLLSRGGLGWLDGFNEYMVRCGLEYAGHAGKDKFINNLGEEVETDLTLHGRIANIPASEVEVEVDREAPHRIRVRGRVDERMFYGPKLELWTEISTEPGSTQFRIEDRVKNQGAYEQEFQIIYHANYGQPLLEKGARFVGPVQRATPFNAEAAKGMTNFEDYLGPTLGFVEQVYCLVPYADPKGLTKIMLENPLRDRGVAMTFAVAQLPYVTLWKYTAAREEGYVTGLEPGTGFPYNRRIERSFGRVPELKPGEERTFRIDVEILKSPDAVNRVAKEIDAIRAGREMVRVAEPPKIE
jgi:hypothetical protein